jgi:hypothetical protein
VIRGLDQVCSAWNVTVLSAFRERAEPPAFSGPASGDEIEPSSAVPTLLAHSLGLAGRRFLYGTDDSVVMAALFRLRRTIESSGARVFRLVPGDLTATADMVVRLSAQGKP